MERKKNVQVGDTIHIYSMVGEPQYNGAEGIVTHIDDANQIHGTWGGCALLDEDTWVVIKKK